MKAGDTKVTKAVIIAAGKGARMHPLTKNSSKGMLPVANRPLLWHIIHETIKAGIRDFVLVVQQHNSDIKNYFGDGSDLGISIQYVTQTEQLGTAHAIYCARDLVDAPFLALNSDALFHAKDLSPLINNTSCNTVVCTFNVDDVSQYGVIELDPAHNTSSGSMHNVTNLVEKPNHHESNLINAGMYRFSENIFSEIKATKISQRGEYEITDTLLSLIKKGQVQCHKLSFWMDVSQPWDLLSANEYILSTIKGEIKGEVEEGATLKGKIDIGKGTTVKSGSYIVGPVVIGDNCNIGPNCFIRPSTALGNNVHIGNAVEVKNSIVMNGASIGHLSYVGDSVIGAECNFGAGTKTSNLRHDGKTIHAMVLGIRINTGRRKLGTIMADGVHTGINTSINVGAVVEQNTMPGDVIRY